MIPPARNPLAVATGRKTYLTNFFLLYGSSKVLTNVLARERCKR
jgi:hypothetical protein